MRRAAALLTMAALVAGPMAAVPTTALAYDPVAPGDMRVCEALFASYDAQDRGIALIAVMSEAAPDAVTQALNETRIGNAQQIKGHYLQMLAMAACPLPAGRSLGHAQYEREARRCLPHMQAGNPRAGACDQSRWTAEPR